MLTPEPTMIGRFEQHTLPDGSTLYYEPDKHQYFGEIKESKHAKGGYAFVRDSRLPGASTIAKHLSDQGDGLLYWAAGLDQQGIATLVERDMKAGASLDWLTDADRISARLRAEKLTWKDVRDQMAEWGTNVHELTFLALAAGKEPSLAHLSEAERGFGRAVFKWWRARNPVPLAAEHVTVSHSRRFGGRFDLLCEFDGARVLVDAKTRTSGKVRRSDHVQLVGYDLANRDCGIGGADKLLALILQPDGTYLESWSTATEADFNCALNAYRAGKSLDKRMGDAAKADAPAETEKEAMPV